jgi:hypothetical protein
VHSADSLFERVRKYQPALAPLLFPVRHSVGCIAYAGLPQCDRIARLECRQPPYMLLEQLQLINDRV